MVGIVGNHVGTSEYLYSRSVEGFLETGRLTGRCEMEARVLGLGEAHAMIAAGVKQASGNLLFRPTTASPAMPSFTGYVS